MPGEVNCLFTKILVPFVEGEVGEKGVAAILQTAGHTREYLTADHNWIPLTMADGLVRLAMDLTGETDEERWARRFGDFGMDWKPTHEERSYIGTYTMGMGSPRAVYQREERISAQCHRSFRMRLVEMERARATFRIEMQPGLFMPKWMCTWQKVILERYPTNWGLPRAVVNESRCAARGADACVLDVRWKNPSLGSHFWTGALTGGAGAAAALVASGLGHLPPETAGLVIGLSTVAGAAVGFAWRERDRRRETERLRDLQSEEILHSAGELEKKFRDLETKIEQLSLLIDLSAAVNATLDTEKIYEQALDRLVHRMGFQAADLLLVEGERGVLRTHRRTGMAGPDTLTGLEFSLDADDSATAKVARTGLPIIVNDVDTTTEPVHLPTARALAIRSFVAVPLRVKDRVFGVLSVLGSAPGRFGQSDVELLAAVANHVALAVDRAESFRTIEELTRGLEDKVRVRTEQLRSANDELQTAYRDLQATQMQLIQREKMASVGQLVAGVAHELNNPIGFVFSNVGTLEDFVKRLRAMLDVYRGLTLPAGEAARVDEQWKALKIDYALKYLDSMIQGIREGAERSRKIVRDLRVFARGQDEVWQAVDLHEELESSLTLLNHLLKDRVTVDRKFGVLPSVECIRSQMDQVFLNLLANAAQAIQGPGAITLETRAENGHVLVTVSDTGPGIAAEVMGKIFDPFFTTKPVGEGTGLGLSISYEIVKKHGGELRAESPPGGGARFSLRLPVARSVA